MSKQKLNEWNDESFKKQPKRWTTKFNGPKSESLTEFERKGGKDKQTPKDTKNPRNMKWS
jgi:hypothetical protein